MERRESNKYTSDDKIVVGFGPKRTAASHLHLVHAPWVQTQTGQVQLTQENPEGRGIPDRAAQTLSNSTKGGKKQILPDAVLSSRCLGLPLYPRPPTLSLISNNSSACDFVGEFSPLTTTNIRSIVAAWPI